MTITACIFDLDGTLIDIFKGHYLGYKKALSEVGVEISEDEFAKYYGQTGQEIVKKLLENHSSTASVEKIRERKKQVFTDYVSQSRVLPGVRELLEELKSGGMKIAIATSARKVTAQKVLKTVKLNVDCPLITEDDVENSKPHPETFLKAAQSLNARPNECIVFEDSIHGIQAAKNAKMKVIAVMTGKKSRKHLEKENPDLIVENMKKGKEEILKLILDN